jgi:hypothetical protein
VGILVCKYTIWQPCGRRHFGNHQLSCEPRLLRDPNSRTYLPGPEVCFKSVLPNETGSFISDQMAWSIRPIWLCWVSSGCLGRFGWAK